MSDIRKRNGPKGTTYQVRYPSKASKTGYAYKTFATIKEARAFRESGEVAKLRSQSTTSGSIITVSDGVDKWLEVCEKEGRDGEPVTAFTLKGYKYRAKVIKSYPWKKNLPDLITPDIIEFRSWLLDRYPRSMAHFILSSFHSMALEMIFRGVLKYDVAAGVAISEKSRNDEPVQIPTKKEVMALLAAADRLANSKNPQVKETWKRYRPILYLAVDSGMRPQEYLAVANSALRDNGVHVTRAVERDGRKLSAPKTAAGRRFIGLSPEVYKIVRRYADCESHSNDYDLIFPTSTGKWLVPQNWRNRGFAAACFEAGLTIREKVKGKFIEKPKYVPYDLRHFYASALIASKKDLKTIQTLMGHEDIKTTLNVYGHLLILNESEASGGMLSTLRMN